MALGMLRTTGLSGREKVNWAPGFHDLCFLTAETTQTAAAISQPHDFPTMMGCTFKLWDKISQPFLNLLWSSTFVTTMREVTNMISYLDKSFGFKINLKIHSIEFHQFASKDLDWEELLPDRGYSNKFNKKIYLPNNQAPSLPAFLLCRHGEYACL